MTTIPKTAQFIDRKILINKDAMTEVIKFDQYKTQSHIFFKVWFNGEIFSFKCSPFETYAYNNLIDSLFDISYRDQLQMKIPPYYNNKNIKRIGTYDVMIETIIAERQNLDMNNLMWV